jgi:hypothetical protein
MLRTVLTFCLIFLLAAICFGQQTGGNPGNKGKVLFKANTQFPAQIDTDVFTEKNKIGDDVNFILTEDVVGDGDKIEKGSILYGRIVGIEKIAPKNDISKVCIMFDFVKKGEEFVSLVASIISIEASAEDIKFNASPTFSGGTVLSLKSKEIRLDKGKIFHVKLIKDISSK